MQLRYLLALTLGLAPIFAAHALAQDGMKPIRYENPEWNMVNLFSFHRSHQSRAMEILETYLIPASIKANSPIEVHELNTGEYQLMLIAKLNGGPDDLNWLIAPEQAKWIEALTEVTGGPDKVGPIMEEWQASISGSEAHLARKLN